MLEERYGWVLLGLPPTLHRWLVKLVVPGPHWPPPYTSWAWAGPHQRAARSGACFITPGDGVLPALCALLPAYGYRR